MRFEPVVQHRPARTATAPSPGPAGRGAPCHVDLGSTRATPGATKRTEAWAAWQLVKSMGPGVKASYKMYATCTGYIDMRDYICVQLTFVVQVEPVGSTLGDRFLNALHTTGP